MTLEAGWGDPSEASFAINAFITQNDSLQKIMESVANAMEQAKKDAEAGIASAKAEVDAEKKRLEDMQNEGGIVAVGGTIAAAFTSVAVDFLNAMSVAVPEFLDFATTVAKGISDFSDFFQIVSMGFDVELQEGFTDNSIGVWMDVKIADGQFTFNITVPLGDIEAVIVATVENALDAISNFFKADHPCPPGYTSFPTGCVQNCQRDVIPNVLCMGGCRDTEFASGGGF